MVRQQWFFLEQGIRIGPVSGSEFRALAQSGRIGPDTPICNETMTAYVPARKVKGLFPDLATVSAPSASAVLPTLPQVPLPPVPHPTPSQAEVKAPSPGDEPWSLADVPPKPASQPDSLFEESPAPAPKTYRRPGYAQLTGRPEPYVHAGFKAVASGPALVLPTWHHLWPLGLLCLVLGWVGGGYAFGTRMYLPDAVAPVCFLAIGGVPLAYLAILHYLRPGSLAIGRVIAVGLFTAIVGIIMLLGLQFLAQASLGTHVVIHGRLGIIWLLLEAIGIAYQWTFSPEVWQRWLGFVFGVGLCEETVKLLPLVALILWRIDKVLSVHSFLAIGFASGIGFGIGEALYCYSPWCGNYGVGSNVIRWYSAIPSHGIYTAVCAAFLWKFADRLEYTDGFWGKAGVVAMAAGLMALVHGTYDTVCSLGVTVSIIMELISFGLLIGAVSWVTRDATEPQPLPNRNPAPVSSSTLVMVIGSGLAVMMLLIAGALGTTRERALPAILLAKLPEPYKPYVHGVQMAVATIQKGSAPITCRFAFDFKMGNISGTFTNTSDDTLHGLTITCRTEGDEDTPPQHMRYEIGDLAAGASTVIDQDRGWSFDPQDSIQIEADGFVSGTMSLP